MADITMCNNKECQIKYYCYRFTAPVNPYRQSYFAGIVEGFTPEKGCKEFSATTKDYQYELNV